MKRSAYIVFSLVIFWTLVLLTFPSSVKAPPFLFVSGTTTNGPVTYLFYDTPGIKQFPTSPGWSISRRLTTNHTGYAIQICTNELYPGGGGGTALDIGYVNNLTDAASISNFAAGGDAWIYQIYDNTTNAVNLTRGGSIGVMAKVCSAGTVFKQNGLVAGDTTGFSTSAGYFATGAPTLSELGVLFVGKDVSSVDNAVVVYAENYLMQVNDPFANTTWFMMLGTPVNASYTSATNNFLLAVVRNFNDVDLYTGALGVENITTGSAPYTQANVSVFNFSGTGYQFRGYAQELILLDNATNNVGAMKTNVFTAYGF